MKRKNEAVMWISNIVDEKPPGQRFAILLPLFPPDVRVTVLTIKGNRKLIEEYISKHGHHVKVIFLENEWKGGFFSKVIRYVGYVAFRDGYLLEALWFIPSGTRVLIKNRPRAIYISLPPFTYLVPALVLGVLAKIMRSKLIIELRDAFSHSPYFTPNFLLRILERVILSLSDWVVFVAEGTRRDYVRSGYVKESKTLAVSNAIVGSFFREFCNKREFNGKGKEYALYGGNVYGTRTLRDIRTVLKRYPSVIVAGRLSKKAQEEIAEMEADIPAGKRVTYLGSLPLRDLLPYICGCRGYIVIQGKTTVPGKSVPIPSKLYIGMALGKETIYCGPEELVPFIVEHGKDIILCKNGRLHPLQGKGKYEYLLSHTLKKAEFLISQILQK